MVPKSNDSQLAVAPPNASNRQCHSAVGHGVLLWLPVSAYLPALSPPTTNTTTTRATATMSSQAQQGPTQTTSTTANNPLPQPIQPPPILLPLIYITNKHNLAPQESLLCSTPMTPSMNVWTMLWLHWYWMWCTHDPFPHSDQWQQQHKTNWKQL